MTYGDLVFHSQSGRVNLGPTLLAPLAAWGVWRRRRWGRFLALGIAVATWLGLIYLALAAVLGPRLTAVPITLAGGAISRVMLLVTVTLLAWSHVALRRPAVRALFPRRDSTPWRPWLSLTVAGAVLTASQIVGGLAAVWLLDIPPAAMRSTPELLANGSFVAIATAFSAPVSVALVAACVLLRGDARPLAAVALRRVSLGTVAGALAAAIVLQIVTAALGVAFDHPQADFVRNVYRTGEPRVLLWLAILVLAPISEEILLRGLLFGDLVTAGTGTAGAIAITSIAFACMHLGQYALWDFVFILVLGALLATARARTGSVYPPIAMHMLVNAGAMLGAAMTVP